MKIDEKKRIHGPWHYDQVADFYIEAIEEARIWHKREREELREIEDKLKIGRHIQSLKDRLKIQHAEQAARTSYRYSYLTAFLSVKSKFNHTKPVLVGPATIESLIEQKPDSYDYLDNGQLPFDNVFFDISQPYPLGFPLRNTEDSRLIGIEMHKWVPGQEIGDGSDENIKKKMAERDIGITTMSVPYHMKLFFQIDGQKSLRDFPINFRTMAAEKETKRHLFVWGNFNPADDTPTNIRFFGDTLTDTIDIVSKEARDLGVRKIDYVGDRYMLSSVPHGEILSKLPNLTINLINYINSHNVTVVPVNRKPRIVRVGGQFIEEPSSRLPFHLITIKDGIEERTKGENKSWELNWRVYVRGCPVKYRDESGRIYLTTWRRPHVRGPPDAPWRESRYEVLAAKLEEERQMYLDLGIKE